MSIGTSMYTALTGINAHARGLEVIGNNIANANTTAYKASRVNFQTIFSRTLGFGTPPLDTTGGSNPSQVGLGVAARSTQRDMRSGSVSPTGVASDLAIDGRGFFVVRRGDELVFTRDGAFRLDESRVLTTADGLRLQGWGVDAGFNVVEGALGDLRIPLDELTIAEATSNVRFGGNLNASGQVGTSGSLIQLMGTAERGLTVIDGATRPPSAPNRVELTSLLTEIEDPKAPGSGSPLFVAGQSIQIGGAEKGGRTLPMARFLVEAGSTVEQFMAFLSEAMGVNTSTGNPDGSSPGVSLDAGAGIIALRGNAGTIHELSLEAANIVLLDAGGTAVRTPLAATRIADAVGESVRTAFVAYDSLGTAVEARLGLVLESVSDAGTTWRYFVESDDNAGGSTQVATGTLEFDPLGRLRTTEPLSIAISRAGTGAASPLTLRVAFQGPGGEVTAYSDVASQVRNTFFDGAPIGTLASFGVERDGTVRGVFDNGVQRTLGRVVLGTFANDQGLVEEGSNLYRVGADSGEVAISKAGEGAAGRIEGAALELSNVDLGQEFINMILTSTGYTASTRVIRTSDELLQQLLALGR